MADNNFVQRLDDKVNIDASKDNVTEIFVENDEPVLGGITVNTSNTVYFDDSSAARICEIDYKDCWEDLRGQLQQYLKDKKGNDYRDPYGRYCVALAIDDLFEWMERIENKYIKNW